MTSNLGNLFGTKNQGLDINMSNDPEIENIRIDFSGALNISSVAGESIKSIEITGSDLTIQNLCVFLTMKHLKNLRRIKIKDTTITNFELEQLKKCNNKTFEKEFGKLEV